MPELRPTTGMPAARASATAPRIACGLARVTAMPSTLSAIASRTSFACPAASGSLTKVSSMPSLAAATSAPLRTRSQKASPSALCVISAILIP